VNINRDAINQDADVKEFHEILSLSDVRLKKTARPAILSTVLFSICVFITFLFTVQGRFHRYWQPFGVICDFLSMAMLLVVVYTVGMAYSAWSVRRLSIREHKEFLEDRYGVGEK
jgi:putative effector of murein hydrolase